MRCGRFSWGGFLILLGVLFLMASLGILSINIWAIVWPLLLIWWGLNLITNHQRPRSHKQRSIRYNNGEVAHLALSIKQVEEAHIRVKHEVGKLEIHGNTAPDELLAGTFGPSGVVYETETADGDTLHLTMQSPPEMVPAWETDEYYHWKFGLNTNVPLSLNVSTGESHTHLDLQHLNLTELRLQSDANETTMLLPIQAGHTRVQIESVMAAIKIYVPAEVAAHIRTRQKLSDIRVDQSRFPQIGNVYESEDYDTAENKVDIHIHTGASHVSVF